MKILHIGKYYHPYFGGMETVLKDLCEQTQINGNHDVRVICSSTNPTYKRETINNIDIIRAPRFGTLFSQPINVSLLYHILKHAAWADIIHIHTPNPLAELCSLLVRKPKVITHHSDIVKQKILKVFYLPLFRLFIYSIQKIIIPTKNHIIYSNMINKYESKYSIIPFGLKESSFILNDEISKKVIEIQKDTPNYFLFVGRLVGYKGVKYLIEAMKGVNATLYIVGQGPLENELKELTKALKLEDKIIFTGRLEDNINFNALYFGSQAIVLPSITPNENFGMTQLEAMKCSKPIITTRLESGVPLVAKEGESSFLVSPASSEELSVAMNKFLNNSKLSKKMGEQAFVRFSKKYKMEDVINSHISLYKSVIKSSLN